MRRVRTTVNAYNFNETINITYITWISEKLNWTNTTISTL